MKTNRMLNIIILLLEGNDLSAQELAERFNVTEKTIYRDIDFIRESGIPIIGKRGVKGGFSVEDRDLVINKKITLKEQHKLMKLLKNQDRMSDEQLNKIMKSIENLFRDNKVDWIDVEFDDPKLSKFFQKLKITIINCNIIELYLKTDDGHLNVMIVEPHQIIIGYDELYLRFFNVNEENWDEISLNRIEDIVVLNENFSKKSFPNK